MKSQLRIIVALCLSLMLWDCGDSKKETNQKIHFYYLASYQNRPLSKDTIAYEEIRHILPGDELVAEEHFEYRGNPHSIHFYSSEGTAPVDGGALKYTLDTLGVIYERAVWWPNFIRLSSNNDSINDLVSVAFGQIMMRSSLRCYYCDDKNSHIPKEVKALRVE